MPNDRACADCGRILPIRSFYPTFNRGGRMSVCVDCNRDNAIRRKYRKEYASDRAAFIEKLAKQQRLLKIMNEVLNQDD
jgi:recombinational DNA repair protein (RecF pathway)